GPVGLETVLSAFVVEVLRQQVAPLQHVQVGDIIVESRHAVVDVLAPVGIEKKRERRDNPGQPEREVRHAVRFVQQFVDRQVIGHHYHKVGDEIGKENDSETCVAEDDNVAYDLQGSVIGIAQELAE